MVLNLEQFKDIVKRKEMKAIHFFEGHGELNERPFERMSGSDNEDLLNQLGKFAKMYPHRFTIWMHTSPGAVTSGGTTMKVDLVEIVKAEVMNAEPMQSVSEIKAQVLAEIKEENNKKALETELQETKALLKKQDDTGEKLSMLIVHILNQLGINPNNIAGVMQGPPGPSVSAERMTYSESLLYLKKVLGESTFIGLAAKFKREPALIESIKNFAK